MKKLIIGLFLLFNLQIATAQSNASLDSISQVCKDIPLDKRIRVTFLGFASTAYINADLSSKMATMLNAALQQVNCYRVLETVQNSYQTNTETAYTNKSTMANSAYATQDGKQLGTQFIIKGEMIEPNSPLGFIIEIINPETRDIIFSKFIEVAEQKRKFSWHRNQQDDLSNLYEEATLKAVTFLVSKRDLLNLTNPNTSQDNADGINETLIKVSKVNFTSFNNMTVILNSLSAFKSVERTFGNNVATYTVRHAGSTDDLLKEIRKKISDKYTITAFNHGIIAMVAR